MGYEPIGVSGDRIKMDDRLKELEVIQEYLSGHPEDKEYKGYTLEKVQGEIESIKSFEFYQ